MKPSFAFECLIAETVPREHYSGTITLRLGKASTPRFPVEVIFPFNPRRFEMILWRNKEKSEVLLTGFPEEDDIEEALRLHTPPQAIGVKFKLHEDTPETRASIFFCVPIVLLTIQLKNLPPGTVVHGPIGTNVNTNFDVDVNGRQYPGILTEGSVELAHFPMSNRPDENIALLRNLIQ